MSETKVVTGVVRLSYVNVYETRVVDDVDSGKYGCAILIPKTDKATIAKINAAVEVAKEDGIKTKWGGKKPVNLKLPLRDGDEDKPEDEAYKGQYFINCNSNKQPGMVDAMCKPLIEPGAIYSGCYARVSITFFPFDSQGSKGIAAGLNNIQKIRDGEPLAGGPTAEEDFGDGEGAKLAEISDDDLI